MPKARKFSMTLEFVASSKTLCMQDLIETVSSNMDNVSLMIEEEGLFGGGDIHIALAAAQSRHEGLDAAIPELEAHLACPPSDKALTADQLRDRYRDIGGHKAFPVSDWQYQVQNGDTDAGYWGWLASEIDALTPEEIQEINESHLSDGPGFEPR